MLTSRPSAPACSNRQPISTKLHTTQVSVSTPLVRFDNNKYSVSARAIGQPVRSAYAERLVIRQDGAVVAEHARQFGHNGDLRPLALLRVLRSRS